MPWHHGGTILFRAEIQYHELIRIRQGLLRRIVAKVASVASITDRD